MWKQYHNFFEKPNFLLCYRNLCNEIGEKTNVYSLEVSMFGCEEKPTELSTINPVRPYSEEDCK